jgi:hypothetical protein
MDDKLPKLDPGAVSQKDFLALIRGADVRGEQDESYKG